MSGLSNQEAEQIYEKVCRSYGSLQTGWYGSPGTAGTGLHLADGQGYPLCGTRISGYKTFQLTAKSPRLSYLLCKRCRQKFLQDMKKWSKFWAEKQGGLR